MARIQPTAHLRGPESTALKEHLLVDWGRWGRVLPPQGLRLAVCDCVGWRLPIPPQRRPGPGYYGSDAAGSQLLSGFQGRPPGKDPQRGRVGCQTSEQRLLPLIHGVWLNATRAATCLPKLCRPLMGCSEVSKRRRKRACHISGRQILVNKCGKNNDTFFCTLF